MINNTNDLGLATDGAFMNEEEVRSLTGHEDMTPIPDKGDIPAENAEHIHHMPEGEVHYTDEEGNQIV
jgi:hypothetical protein